MDSPDYGPIAPYVVHSADFGSEPVGDGLDGGGEQFVADLGLFKKKMNSYGIPVGISEDWDRPGVMSGENGIGLVITATPISCLTTGETYLYLKRGLTFRNTWNGKTVCLPTMITETQWAWGPNTHMHSRSDVGVKQYTQYWKMYDQECEMFKKLNVGWFLRT